MTTNYSYSPLKSSQQRHAPAPGTTLSGAEALIAALELAGVETVFGLPGGCILPAYDPLLESSIRHVLVRHEQGAGHMAEGFAHVTGRPGVLLVTSGPAATNIVTPLCDAFMDSIPLVAITGQVATTSIGTDAFQECDTVGITRSVTKHNEIVFAATDIPLAVRRAFFLATTGRPGPVLLDMPKDVLQSQMQWYWPSDEEVLATLPGVRPQKAPSRELISQAADLVMTASRPVLYAGGGVLKSRAARQLRELAELLQIPVTTTLMARGSFPDAHELALGMPGMHGTAAAVTAMQRSDLLIALGARFDDRVTGKVATFAPDAKVIHVDIDPAEHGKIRRPDVSIVSDLAPVLDALLDEVRARLAAGRAPQETSSWLLETQRWKRSFPLTYATAEPGGMLKPQYCIERLNALAPNDTILVTGVGQHQMWASQYWSFTQPYTFVNSGGLGTMGFAVPAAVGVKAARPESTVWAVDGDGCFQMTSQELVTASIERLPIKVAILNNSHLGMVRQWQEMFYDERYSNVHLDSYNLPDFAMLAAAMGCSSRTVFTAEELDEAIIWANNVSDRPVVLDIRVDAGEKVFPMVPAGASNDDLLLPDSQNDLRGEL